MKPETSQPAGVELRRELSLLDSTMINVGCIIGSGIFLVPATIALYLHSSVFIILAWILGGVVSLFGALSIAEIGALFPRAGGQYVYLREAYGPLWGFLYGWTAFAVIMTAAISAVAVGFATYLGYFIPLSPIEIKIVAMLSILVLTLINCFGVKAGAIIQNGLTFVKIGILAALVILGVVMKGENIPGLFSFPQSVNFSTMVGPFGLALVAVLWSYDGWIEITYVAGEVKNPQKNIPQSIILSTLIVILAYILINIAYVAVLSLDTISSSALVASDAAIAIVGSSGATIAVIGVIISTLGSNNGFILTGARIYYAMASENLFFKPLARVNPKFLTPIPSLVCQGIWSCALVLTGTFDQLFTYVIFASWIFYALSAGAVMRLRKKLPGLHRPYKTWGYPFTPVIFILFSIYLVVNTLIQDPRDALIGLGIILLGLPAYFYWSRQIKRGEA